MKKLYTVEVTYKVVVIAGSIAEAEKEAQLAAPDVDADLYVSAFYLPSGWDGECLPFGDQDGEDELTIGELIEKGAVY